MTDGGLAPSAANDVSGPGPLLVVDSSAAVALLLQEPGWKAIRDQLDAADIKVMSTATAIELGVVLSSRMGEAGRVMLDAFIQDSEISLVAVERAHVDRALSAWRRFGKGNHRAALNLGDLFTYALADEAGRAILCTGEDFAATDLPVVPGRAEAQPTIEPDLIA